MLSLFFLLVLFYSLNVVFSSTPYTDCGSEIGSIQTFSVTGCATAPCIFTQGNTYAMNLTFQAKASSNTATVSIHGIVGGVPVPFPLPDSDACKLGIKCPIEANDVNSVSLSLPVLSSYPTISLYVKIEIKSDDQNKDYTCLRFPARITRNSYQRKYLVGWQKGKLFEMLD